jgi:hypothetical protein
MEGYSLREVCRDERMPSRDTVRRWLRDKPEFQAQYALACQHRADAFADEIIEMADDGSNDWQERQHGPSVNAENIQRSKLRIEARKWLMSKVAPRKYGEKLAIGGDADASPVKVELSTTDLARRIAFTLARAMHETDRTKG